MKKLQYIIDDRKYHFRSAFDTETGAYVRTGILDENGKDTGKDPFMAFYPHLIDVGIMGHCIHGKTGLCSSVVAGVAEGIKKQDIGVALTETVKKFATTTVNKVDIAGLVGYTKKM